jgi:hypothetical protein
MKGISLCSNLRHCRGIGLEVLRITTKDWNLTNIKRDYLSLGCDIWSVIILSVGSSYGFISPPGLFPLW